MTGKLAYIDALALTPHPEGGWYRQTFQSDDKVFDNTSQAARYQYTSIYFLLDDTHPSHFHRLTHDELWFFHDGAPVTIHCIAPDGNYSQVTLGADVTAGERLQFKVPHDTIFASEVTQPNAFGLVSCVVAPGFDFADFTLVSRETLLAAHPGLVDVIERLAD